MDRDRIAMAKTRWKQ